MSVDDFLGAKFMDDSDDEVCAFFYRGMYHSTAIRREQTWNMLILTKRMARTKKA